MECENRSLYRQFFMQKVELLREAMDRSNVDYAVVKRRDNFAWLTCGGTNAVVLSEQEGVCLLLVGGDKVYLLAKTMDAPRIYHEELWDAKDVEVISLKWFECSCEEKAVGIVKGSRVVTDCAFDIYRADNDFFQNLHFPLNALELERYALAGQLAEEAMFDACSRIAPGMTELEAYRVLMEAYQARGMTNLVNLLGANSRPMLYKHCVAGDTVIKDYVLIATAGQKWGLTIPLTRSVYFGSSLPGELEDRYQTVCGIAAETIAMCRPGVRFYDISQRQKALFANAGHSKEWEQHFQGGLTGYFVNNPGKCTDRKAVVKNNQSFNWYVSILGAKVEETTITGETGTRMVTENGKFPLETYKTEFGDVTIPQILLR